MKNETFLIADVILNGRLGKGFIRIHEPAANKIDVKDMLDPVTISRNLTQPPIVCLSSTECSDPALSGGKAASLAQMFGILDQLQNNHKNVFIPDGLCLTSTAHQHHINNHPNLSKVISEVNEACKVLNLGKKDKPIAESDLDAACKRCQVEFKQSELEGHLKESIQQALHDAFGLDAMEKSYAVRSSALGEDSEELSAAGQNSTFLGCRGMNGIMSAVLDCWASLYSRQSVEYRRQNGQEIAVGMAVVVQEMAAPKSAGVIFTRDPATGDPSKILITANYGLGESVVSATSDPDAITVKHKFWEEPAVFEVGECQVGSKATKVVASPTGTSEQQVDKETASKLCLDPNDALRLAKLAAELELRFQGPRDIEFAIAENGDIFILQSRPITTLHTWTDDELLHEFDHGCTSKEDMYTTANVG